MTNIPNETERLTGRTAVDPSGDKIGTIADGRTWRSRRKMCCPRWPTSTGSKAGAR